MPNKKSKSIVIKNAIIASDSVLYHHVLVVEGDRISKIVPQKQFRARPGSIVIDGHGKILLPGFINAHMHFYSTFARGLSRIAPSKNFNEILQNLWWKLDRQLTLADCKLSAQIALIEAIRHGTTTLIDHHASPHAVKGSLFAMADAVKESGLRASLCYEVSDRDGEAITQAGLNENYEFIEYTQKTNHPQLRALFGLHASFTVSNKTLEQAVSMAHSLGAGLHIHTAEAPSDQEHCLLNHKMRVVERFFQRGLLGPHTLCAHGVHLNENEMDLLAQTQTPLIHNAQSNMNNAVGAASVLKMIQKGVRVGLGTDAMTLNMLEEMRTALWLQKHHQRDPGVAFTEIVQALVKTNPEIASLHWGIPLGKIQVGAAADVILIDYLPPTPLDSSNYWGHLCFGISQAKVDTTIVGGKILMKNKQLQIKWDEEEIASKSRELAKKLWSQF